MASLDFLYATIDRLAAERDTESLSGLADVLGSIGRHSAEGSPTRLEVDSLLDRLHSVWDHFESEGRAHIVDRTIVSTEPLRGDALNEARRILGELSTELAPERFYGPVEIGRPDEPDPAFLLVVSFSGDVQQLITERLAATPGMPLPYRVELVMAVGEDDPDD